MHQKESIECNKKESMTAVNEVHVLPLVHISTKILRKPKLKTVVSLIHLLILIFIPGKSKGNGSERYSFSLTTFDPRGRLGQVERALQSASAGTPIVAFAASIKNESFIFLIAPQILPNFFMIDDGTPRFSQVSDQLIMSHSGLSADGRVLMTAAKRLAIEYKYTFDEEISCEIFLEQMSLLMLEYTMRAGTRPFGASLVIGFVPRNHATYQSPLSPRLYHLDPSGKIEVLDSCSVINGNGFLQRSDIHTKLQRLVSQASTNNSPFLDKANFSNRLVAVIRESLSQINDSVQTLQNSGNDRNTIKPDNWTILTACLSSNEPQNISINRHET